MEIYWMYVILISGMVFGYWIREGESSGIRVLPPDKGRTKDYFEQSDHKENTESTSKGSEEVRKNDHS